MLEDKTKPLPDNMQDEDNKIPSYIYGFSGHDGIRGKEGPNPYGYLPEPEKPKPVPRERVSIGTMIFEFFCGIQS